MGHLNEKIAQSIANLNVTIVISLDKTGCANVNPLVLELLAEHRIAFMPFHINLSRSKKRICRDLCYVSKAIDLALHTGGSALLLCHSGCELSNLALFFHLIKESDMNVDKKIAEIEARPVFECDKKYLSSNQELCQTLARIITRKLGLGPKKKSIQKILKYQNMLFGNMREPLMQFLPFQTSMVITKI